MSASPTTPYPVGMDTQTLEAPPQSKSEQPFDTWIQEGKDLFTNYQMSENAHENSQWEIGDWLVRGEKKFKQAYAEAERITGWSNDYLRTVKWVVNRFPLSL